MSKKLYQDKEWLVEKYTVEGLSLTKTAVLAGCSESTIIKWMDYHEIPRRRWAERRRKHAETTKANWDKGVYSRHSEAIKIARARGAYDGVFQSPTSIEIAVSEALDTLNIEHEPQYRPDGYSRIYDEFIPPGMLVEVQGDYWHSSDEAQERDAEKATWARDNGYHLVVIWEHEIHNRGALELVKERAIPLLEL